MSDTSLSLSLGTSYHYLEDFPHLFKLPRTVPTRVPVLLGKAAAAKLIPRPSSVRLEDSASSC